MGNTPEQKSTVGESKNQLPDEMSRLSGGLPLPRKSESEGSRGGQGQAAQGSASERHGIQGTPGQGAQGQSKESGKEGKIEGAVSRFVEELPKELSSGLKAAQQKGEELVEQTRGYYGTAVERMRQSPGIALAAAAGVGFIFGAYLFRRR